MTHRTLSLLAIFNCLALLLGCGARQAAQQGDEQKRTEAPARPKLVERFDGPVKLNVGFDPFSSNSRIEQWSLRDLVREETIDVDSQELRDHSEAYEGKKIRIVGHIESGFEWMNLIAEDGKSVGAWPLPAGGLGVFLRQSGWDKRLEQIQKQEYVGFMSGKGGYGHLNAWPYYFTIVEVYPHGDDAKRLGFNKDDLRRDYEQFLELYHLHSYLRPEPETIARKEFRARLQGKWNLVRCEGSGTSGISERSSFVFLWDRMTWYQEIGRRDFKVIIDPDRAVAAIDIWSTGGLEVYRPFNPGCGVFELRGDQLNLRLEPRTMTLSTRHVPRNRLRPQSFELEDDPKPLLLVLRRDPNFQVNLDRNAYRPDDPELVKAISGRKAYDGFGRVIEVHLDRAIKTENLDLLANLKHVERVSLRPTEFPSGGLKKIAELPNLVSLTLSGYQFDDSQLRVLTSAKGLKALTVTSDRFTGSVLNDLRKLPELAHLDVGQTKLQNHNLIFLKYFSKLRTLVLPNSVSDRGLKQLGGLDSLEELTLRGEFTNQGLANLNLKAKTELRVLSLSAPNCTDAGLDGIQRLVKLRSLQLFGRLSDRTLERLSQCSSLRYLRVSGSDISDHGVEHLAKLHKLEALELSGIEIKKNGLNGLLNLRQLRRLHLGGASSLGDSAVQNLKQMTQLDVLEIDREHIEIIKELQESLPNTSVHGA